nr:RNA-directed DNA polymerase, eukaryota, nucleotide-binding alpha-beta plait domain protein [Tanacetum cinerariifolium]
MFKWVWRFFSQKNSLWVRVVKVLHGEDGKIGKKVQPRYPSTWLNIINEIESLKLHGIDLVSFITPKLGNGVNTSFWDASWCGDIEFKNLVPDFGSGDFSVSSVRKLIDNAILPKGISKTRWIKEVPIKINVHAWKVIHDCLPTRFNISRRDSTTRDLWKVCSDYGTVVDVFIPFKRSKSGKHFAFVRFIKVINLECLVSNLCTIWIGRYHLHANYVRFERPQKPNSFIPRGPNHSTPKETNMENSRKSFVSVLKRGSQSHVTPEITNPALVLDGACIKEFDFGMSLIGREKDVYAIPNLPCIISKEGFQNVKLLYLGGMWVVFEFDSLALKEKFLNHSGTDSWFTKLIQATSSFENDERIVWISTEGLPIKAWTPNTFCKIASLWGEYVELEEADLKSLSCKHLCLKTNMKVIINERQKVIIQGKVYWIRVKELDAWFLNFQEDDQDDLSSDGES